MIDAVEHKCHQSRGKDSHELPEFQAFFNDQTSNDFNQLFTSLPPERRYFAAGLPGSFRSRLFPSASLHFVNSAYAIQILSLLPKEVVDKSSPARNKGRIHYSNSAPEVVKALMKLNSP
ncbi:SAM dependent carboxyl methyltransferase [Trema orientale]|uniref:SAM dependent carboxyl methyltransferase n=1 Tax=Trema orientale TaxID=63057 RepID=A0A2P5AAB9_TREOI|nr:SAM dependent carboxyl methyltransferase [Trema orientale]